MYCRCSINFSSHINYPRNICYNWNIWHSQTLSKYRQTLYTQSSYHIFCSTLPLDCEGRSSSSIQYNYVNTFSICFNHMMRLKSPEMFILVIIFFYCAVKIRYIGNENTHQTERRKPFNYSKIGIYLSDYSRSKNDLKFTVPWKSQKIQSY